MSGGGHDAHGGSHGGAHGGGHDSHSSGSAKGGGWEWPKKIINRWPILTIAVGVLLVIFFLPFLNSNQSTNQCAPGQTGSYPNCHDPLPATPMEQPVAVQPGATPAVDDTSKQSSEMANSENAVVANSTDKVVVNEAGTDKGLVNADGNAEDATKAADKLVETKLTEDIPKIPETTSVAGQPDTAKNRLTEINEMCPKIGDGIEMVLVVDPSFDSYKLYLSLNCDRYQTKLVSSMAVVPVPQDQAPTPLTADELATLNQLLSKKESGL